MFSVILPSSQNHPWKMTIPGMKRYNSNYNQVCYLFLWIFNIIYM